MSRWIALIPLIAFAAGCDYQPPRPGSVFIAQNGFRVVALDAPATFEVLARGASGGQSFFCAAGDYANVMLNARAADRVVVTRPVGPSVTNPNQRGTSFALVPRGEAPPRARGWASVRTDVTRRGENFTVAHSMALCRRNTPGVFGGGFEAI